MNRKELTQLLIADTLKQLSCSRSLSKITIMDITRACGINRSTFYYHFIDKDDVIEWIFRYDIEDHYISVANEGWRENFQHALTAFQRGIDFYRQALSLGGIHNLGKIIYESTYKKYFESIENPESMVPNLLVSDLDETERRQLADFYSRGVTAVYTQYIQTGAEESVESMMNFFEDLTTGYKASLIAIAERKKARIKSR